MPLGPAPTTVTAAVAGAASRTGRSLTASSAASSRVASGWANSAAPGTAGSALPLPTA